jgi:hypothetical protein
MNCVIFSCAKTGRAFNSGLHADPDHLRFVPPQWKTWLRCRVCYRVHEFKFAGHVFVNARTTAVGTASCAYPNLLGSQGHPGDSGNLAKFAATGRSPL